MGRSSRVLALLVLLALVLSVGLPRRPFAPPPSGPAGVLLQAAGLLEDRLARRPQDRFGLSGPAVRADARLRTLARWVSSRPDASAGIERVTAWGLEISSLPPPAPERLPRRAPRALGEAGLRALAVGGANLERLRPPVRLALARLVGAIEHWDRRARRGRMPPESPRALARAVDEFVAACRAGGAADGPLTPLPEEGGTLPRRLLFVGACEAGWIVLGGPGPTLLPVGEAALAVDLGGDDRWLIDTGFLGASPRSPRVKVCIDLGGKDVWRSDEAVSGGRVLLVADREGSDRYVSADGGWSAAGGTLVIDDGAGDDHYEAEGPGFAAASGGAALLFDRAGDDQYSARGGGLAEARTGRSLLVDVAGNDLYVAGSGEEGGIARAAEGGWAALLDLAGDDVYRAGERALASAEAGAVALLLDAGGDDLYRLVDRGLGHARANAFAALFDLGGDDDVLAGPRALGAGRNAAAVAWFEGGRDRFVGASSGRGRGDGAGFFVFGQGEGGGPAWGSLPADQVPGGPR